MLYKSKLSLSRSLGIDRETVTRMIKRGEVKPVFNEKNKKIGFVMVMEFISYLVKN